MDNWFESYQEQFKELWGNLNKRAKIMIGVGIGVVIVSLLFLIFWGGNTRYQPLFSQLSPQDANAIVERLDESGIPYQLSDNGRTILVPAQQVHKLRIDMAGAGLPTQGVVGFEIFDQSSFGTTDFERRVNFYRAIGGELSRSIQAMQAVDFAKVQISPPKESLFIDEEQPAEASVLLRLVPGYKLKEAQVNAITNLVASSVQGLEPDKVTIVDTNGNLLTRTMADDSYFGNQLTYNQFEIQRQFAQGLQADLESLLSRVLGPDNFTVQVKARLNFDRREVESKEYSPVVDDEGIVRSQEEQTESYEGNNAAAQGVPGTTSNTAQYQETEGSENGGSYEHSDVITNYEINEKIERHVYAPGKVEQISVAVVVDEAVEEDGIQKIRDVVRAAIGYNQERGDVVAVTRLAFDESLEEEMAQYEAQAQQARRREMYIYAGLIAFILIILFVIIMVLRPSRRPEEEEIVPGKAIDFMVDEESEEAAATSELSEEAKKRKELRENIADVVAEKPEEVAQLLKSWLMED